MVKDSYSLSVDYLVHLMNKLPSVMPDQNLLNGFPTSHLMCHSKFSEINLCSLNISKSHKTSLWIGHTKKKIEN